MISQQSKSTFHSKFGGHDGRTRGHAYVEGFSESRSHRQSNSVEVTLRNVLESDIPIFFEQQLELDANCLANSQTHVRHEFLMHWAAVKRDDTNMVKCVIADGSVAGYLICWEQSGKKLVGYWLGQQFRNSGIATKGLEQFLLEIKSRPLFARVAKSNLGSMTILNRNGFTIHDQGFFLNMFGDVREEFLLSLEKLH